MATIWGGEYYGICDGRRGTYLVGTSNNPRKPVLLLPSPLHHRLDDARVVRPQIYKTMRDAGVPQRLEKGKRRCVHVRRRGCRRRQGPSGGAAQLPCLMLQTQSEAIPKSPRRGGGRTGFYERHLAPRVNVPRRGGGRGDASVLLQGEREADDVGGTTPRWGQAKEGRRHGGRSSRQMGGGMGMDGDGRGRGEGGDSARGVEIRGGRSTEKGCTLGEVVPDIPGVGEVRPDVVFQPRRWGAWVLRRKRCSLMMTMIQCLVLVED